MKIFRTTILGGALGILLHTANAAVPVMDLQAIANLANQLTQIKMQVDMMKQNLVNLGQFNWNDINSAAGQLAQSMNAMNSLSYAAQNIDSQFQQTYTGYKPAADYSSQYQQITQTTLNTVQGSLKAMNMSYSQFQSDSQRLKAMQAQAEGADGALKALQVNAQIGSEVAQQVASLRSVMMTQASSEQTYVAQQTQLEAQRKANKDAMINNGLTSIPAYGTYPADVNF